MILIREYTIRLMFALGILMGVQIPSFIEQYSQRLEAHYLEANENFSGFQETADHYFDGDTKALIQWHRKSDDPVFSDEADTVEALDQRLAELTEQHSKLQTHLAGQLFQIIIHRNRSLLQETTQGYQATIPLTTNAILCGLISAVLISLLTELLLWPIAYAVSLLFPKAHYQR